jgi:transcriptional regulator with XRE-family HTH domain
MGNDILDVQTYDFELSSADAAEGFARGDHVPLLLFLLILIIFCDVAVGSPNQNLTLVCIAILLLFSSLLSSLQLARNLKQTQKAEAERARKLKISNDYVSKIESELSEARTETEKAREEIAAAHKELAESNLMFDNYNLQLEITASELQSSKSETDVILATVKQGVFLIGRDGSIGTQYSKELKNMFHVEDFAFRNFLQILRPLLPENRYQTIADYVRLLFNSRKNEQQLQRFNPLKCGELNFQRAEGGFELKYIEFTFTRIMEAGDIKKVLVTAVNVSERVKLEAQLREGEERREHQLELLCELLQVESPSLHDFMDEAKAVVDEINRTFRELSSGTVTEQTSVLREKVNASFRLFHNLKSQSAALKLGVFEKAIHQIEEPLHELRRKQNLVNADLLNILVLISAFQASMSEASDLIAKISGLRHSFGSEQATEEAENRLDLPLRNTPSSELKRSVADLAQTVMARSGKKARIEWNLSEFDELPLNHRHILRDGVFQLVRNSLIHGIESPAERERNGKDPFGLVSVTMEPLQEKRGVRLCCRDDGAGLNPGAIRNHAVSEKLLTEAEAQALPESDLYALIFEPGFSTASEVTEDAGRGVGLDALRASIEGQLKGEICMKFRTGQYCQFELMIPVP